MSPASKRNSTNVRIFQRDRTAAPVALGATRLALGLLGRTSPALAARYAERLFTTARRHPRPAWEAEALASARYARVDHDGAWLPTWTWGPDAAPAVLLVHGWEGRGSQLAAFVPPLVDLGLRVVAFDGPGHGDSPTRRANLVDHARAVLSTAARAGDVRLVVAHSMGAAATLLATRLGLRATAFALVAPPTSPASYLDGFSRLLAIAPAVRADMIRRLEDRLALPFHELDATLDAARLDAPLLVVHDEDDREVPVAEGRRLVAAARDARLVATRALGHRRILRSPAVVGEVEAFAAAFAARRDPTAASSPHGDAFASSIAGELFFREQRTAS